MRLSGIVQAIPTFDGILSRATRRQRRDSSARNPRPGIGWKTQSMPSITGQLGVILTVRDAERSAEWYETLLGAEERYNHASADGSMHYVCLNHPDTALELCLVSHAGNRGEHFNEQRAGLDHLEFLVANREDLMAWANRLDEMGVAHSGVKELTYTKNAMVTFRDPDNIQLEFFWRAPLHVLP